MMIPFVMKRAAEPCPFREIPIVADGLLFPGGMVALAWRGDIPSVAFFSLPEDMMAAEDGNGYTVFTARNDTWGLDLDPWHQDAFKGTPGEGVVGGGGKRRVVWSTVDWCGNTTGVLGPAGDDAVHRKLLAIWREQDKGAPVPCTLELTVSPS